MEVVNCHRVIPFATKDTSQIREILAPENSSIQNQRLAAAIVAPGQITEGHYHIRTEEIYHIERARAGFG